jgi:S-DNA-T family DNA segregation ATPase FtsK/SpoIIIE
MPPSGTKKPNTASKGNGGGKAKANAGSRASAGKGGRPAQAKDPLQQSRLHEEIAAIILLAVALFLMFALFVSAAGAFGVYVSAFFKGVFGPMAYALPFFLLLFSILLFAKSHVARSVRTIVLSVIIFFLLILVISGFMLKAGVDPFEEMTFGKIYSAGAKGKGAGLIGTYLGGLLIAAIGRSGLLIFSIALFIVAVLLLARTTLSQHMRVLAEKREAMRDKREARLQEQEALEAQAEKLRMQQIAAAERTQGGNPAMAENYSIEEKPASFNRRPIIVSSDDGPLDLTPADLSDKQANILDAVKNDEIHIGGQGTGLGLDRGGNGPAGAGLGLMPEDIVPAGSLGTGLGLDPNHGVASGYGLGNYGDDAEELFENEPFSLEDVPPLKVAENLAEETPVAKPEPAPVKPAVKKPKAATSGFIKDNSEAAAKYTLPPVDLLKKVPKSAKTESNSELQARAAKLEQTLKDFRVDAKVVKVTVGPTVTRYEVEPDVGVKIQSIKSLEPDLALKLEVKSVRVVPMPGTASLGIEAYNARTELVSLRDIIDSPEFRLEDSKISFALGKNISGERMIANLADMPHLLIAGTTGSGKSVCINSILLSILYRAKPSEVKLILVDPKVVELKSYNDIPHLLVPVVTDPERAATALNYAVTIMNERYHKFAESGVRNLDGYNELLKKEGQADEVLPQIVIVIDELSDLMMIAPAKVQESISRLAAMARAAGMHLIVATQQPLASILTSVIKANIPSRIAFSVSSNSASRVILDEPGAERLHGNGDMLFSPVGTREPMRIQGSFVSDSEVHKVTEYVKKQMDPDYSADILEVVNSETTGELTEEEDDLFRDAVEMVVSGEQKQASVSMIQRRFRVGYNRAARLVDMMEERGIVAASDGTNKPRKVIMTEGQLADFLSGGEAGLSLAHSRAGGRGLDDDDDSAAGGLAVAGVQPVNSEVERKIVGGIPGGRAFDVSDDEPPFDLD